VSEPHRDSTDILAKQKAGIYLVPKLSKEATHARA